ncbi:unnamed protein product (macronuclear) [Paramecium tetraurelia]|uniref:EF-hand domain-containing protein n=1 Tax=Paramecium tetraurelia TaxID=5888 RepID=A0CJA2_PARTE|nr:uncharacterized protein GSPATT00000580001 [Paramecium tetraurelia]CAK70869.1 unnamed protein product [Paramecium tetraurelia]|eukprot:XP_001438266.1 hypothetical protein (macronuclear) [Paramecium tetraurelia strain d4-2]
MISRKETSLSQNKEKDEKHGKLMKQPSSFFKSFNSSKKGVKDGEDFQFFVRNQDCSFYTIFYMLVNFSKVEEDQKKKGFSLLTNSKPLMNMETYNDISVLHPELIYFFSVISVRDLHDFYIDFYASFDANKNFTLERKELTKMFTIVLDFLGHKKFKVFSDRTLIEADAFEGKLTQKQIDDISENFLLPEDQSKVDYLLIFPYILSFYLEYSYQEIKNKQKRLEIIKGIETIKGKEVEIKNITSLISILKEMGIDYFKEKNTYKLSYRDVENILLKFKNIQKWMTFDVIQQILQSLSKIMQVDAKTQEETKKIKVHKIIDFLALKLCVHQNCLKIKQQKNNVNQSVFLEILILWNCAQYSQWASEKYFTQKFQKYLNSHYYGQQSFSRTELQRCLEGFFKKFFQLMPKQQIYKIIQCHQLFTDENIVRNQKIEREDLIQSLYSMVCQEGFKKLKQYVKIKFDGIIKSTGNTVQYSNYGKIIDQESVQGGISSQRQLLEQSQQQNQNTTNKVQQKEKKEEESEKSESSEEETKNVKVTQKFKTAVRAIQSGNAFIQEKKEGKDILKACLIMDSFLKRQTQRIKSHCKETKSLNSSFIKQDLSRIETQQNQLENNDQSLIFDPSAQINQKRKEQKQSEFCGTKKEKEKKGWEISNNQVQKTENTEVIEILPSQDKAKVEQNQDLVFTESKNKHKDRNQISNELQMILGKSNDEFGPNNFKKAIRLQSTVEASQSARPFIKQSEQQDNLVIIDETALEQMIKSNQNKTKVKSKTQNRKSTRDDCQCRVF